ncbi:hypothetical protein VARIO8X_130130 [Burkholderiales bacterium 8X]|nr:hypothetical protein VARIO8X_130130 [Burkholderiales bacterium 8X]
MRHCADERFLPCHRKFQDPRINRKLLELDVYEASERIVSEEHLDLSAPFYNTIRGLLLSPQEIIQRGDKKNVWTYFETDEGCE